MNNGFTIPRVSERLTSAYPGANRKTLESNSPDGGLDSVNVGATAPTSVSSRAVLRWSWCSGATYGGARVHFDGGVPVPPVLHGCARIEVACEGWNEGERDEILACEVLGTWKQYS